MNMFIYKVLLLCNLCLLWVVLLFMYDVIVEIKNDGCKKEVFSLVKV